MTDRPIVFSAPQVRALLEGRKTQTRRIVKKTSWGADGSLFYSWKLPIKPGDRLWVRETHVIENTREYHGEHEIPTDGRPVKQVRDREWGSFDLIPHYRATEPDPNIIPYEIMYHDDDRTRWTASLFMPRWASRITLDVTDIRIESLHEISKYDAIAEGGFPCGNPLLWFKETWIEIHGPDAWAVNPLVAAISFNVTKRNIDELA